MLRAYESVVGDGHLLAVITESRQNELNERINRWLMGVQPEYVAPRILTSNVKSRRRLSKPYTRVEPPLRLRISSGTPAVEENRWAPPEVCATPVQEAEREGFESRTVSPVIFRELEELPEPQQNPLVCLLF